jgi:fatty-acyl-CoA synthase
VTTLEGPPIDEAEGIGALTTGGVLEQAEASYSENEALVFDDPLREGETVRWTYGDLAAEARRVAAAIVATGAGKGARVGILMGNRPEAVAAFFGAGIAGAVAVPLSTFSSLPELEFLLEHADVEVLLTQTAVLGRHLVDDLLELCPDPDKRSSTGEGFRYPYLRHAAAVGLEKPSSWVQHWEGFLRSGDGVAPSLVAARQRQVSPGDHGVVTYSSGTTDRPKGILHTHMSPALQFWIQARVFGRRTDTRLWTSLPMFWTAGLNTAMGATLAAGGCWVMQETFDAGAALRLMERERVTEPYSLPHQTAALEEHPDWLATDLSSLRCVYGKSAFPRHPTVNGDTGWMMPVGYGLSETCSAFASHHSDTPRSLQKASTGRLLPGNRLRVVDPDTGTILGAGEDGEFAITGPTMMDHYVKKRRDECFDADGFFHTGDVGHFDSEGYVHWTGRRSEMIKTGGANVSPAEIEVALRACQPVKLARVIGVADARMGQVAVLCVVVKEGMTASEPEIREFLRQRVAAYKVPRHVLFFTDGDLPMTGSSTKVRDGDLARLVETRMAGLAEEPLPDASTTPGAGL